MKVLFVKWNVKDKVNILYYFRCYKNVIMK